jgi:hypothetical protein
VTRGPCTFKQQDLVRALKGAKAAGFGVTRIEIDAGGKVIVMTSQGTPVEPSSALEKWKQNRARAS